MSGIKRIPWWLWVILLGSLGWNTFGWWQQHRRSEAQRTMRMEQMDRHTSRAELLRALPADSGAIVFLGDSHVEGAPLTGLFPGLPVLGMGISGGTTAEVAGLVPEVLGPAPAAVIVAVGINDLFNRTAPDSQFVAMGRLLDAVRAHSPRTRLVVLGLMPTEDARQTPAIATLNKGLAGVAHERGATFIDPLPRFLANDRLDPALTYDGLHLNLAGYTRWRDLLRPAF